MRRFASVFSSSVSTRRDKDESKKSLKRAVSVSVADDVQPAQSSSSSSGSASIILKTPDDIPLTPASIKSKSWIPWRSKKSNTAAVRDPLSQWQPGPAPLLRPPPLGRLRDDSDYGDSDDEAAVTIMPAVTPESLSKSAQFIRTHTGNSLINQPSPRPFLIQNRSPLYPRSCNSPRSVHRPASLLSSLHKRRLLRRLDDTASLTPSEAESIIRFSVKPLPMAISSPQSSDSFNEKALSRTERVSPFSPGLRRWISRPTFEDRFSVWTPALDDTITCQRITVSDFALAALEFSEALEVSADGDQSPQPVLEPTSDLVSDDTSPSPIPTSPAASDVSSSPSSSSTNLSTGHSRNTPHLSAPSPLRNEHNPISPLSPTSNSSLPPTPPSIAAPPAVKSDAPVTSVDDSGKVEPTSNAKRGVRFAENDNEENVPIGYVLRMKKQREEKARFLREEKERRMFEEERAKVDEERQRRELERSEWEKERAAWEKEKRAIEEERKKRVYAEQVIAARQRAESSRSGMKVQSSSVSLRDPPERNVPSAATKRYSRPVYDSARRQVSEPAMGSNHSSSPDNSRPPSIAIPANLHPPTSSRPPSVYSAQTMSSEDVRNSQMRNYAASNSSSRHGQDRSSTYSTRSTSNPNLMVPPLPVMPPFSMDMPLLPPTAPFMMNQYPRSRSRNSSPGHSSSNSPSSSRQRLHSNGSTEQINSPRPRLDSSPRNSMYGSSSSSSPHRHSYQSHQRRASDDSNRRLSSYSQADQRGRLPQSPSSPHLAHHSSTMPRGRPVHPAHHQSIPSPWTAPPSAKGTIPTSMPYSMPSNPTVSRHPPSRRQTAIS